MEILAANTSSPAGPFRVDEPRQPLGILTHPTNEPKGICTLKKVIMTRFRPCIDLHAGQVKQIVGGTLSATSSDLRTNHVSVLPAAHFAELYKAHALTGGHVIMLGPGNDEAAMKALSTWPDGLQVGGGINPENARRWIEKGAEKVGSSILCCDWRV